jgi:nicotinate-nucleotide pyrophosphorylase (carboxylating)
MNYLKEPEIKDIVALALKEDTGTADVTSELYIPKDKKVKALIVAKDDFIVCGLNVALLVFKERDSSIVCKTRANDGEAMKRGRVLLTLSGNAQSILSAERVALNFLSLLSGIATKTKSFVEAVKPYPAKILDTRKTIPGLRILEKYAVRIGGGFNHRMSLDEMVLLKDNHLAVVGGINNLTGLSRKYKTEIEVKNLEEFKKAMELNPDIIMLDNMELIEMKEAVRLRNRLNRRLPKIEASGGVTLKNVKKVASTGVDLISVGNLTSSIDYVDISLEII